MVSIYFPFTLGMLTVTSIRGGRVLLALFALQLDAEPFIIGLLTATFSIPPMLLAFKVGQFVDRYGSRWPLLVGITGSALGVLVPFFIPTVPAMFVAAFMNGLAFTFYNVSVQNAVGLLSTPGNRVKNFANFSLVISAAQFIAPVLVGFAIDHYGAGNTCLYVAMVAAVAASLIAFRGQGLPGGTGRSAKDSGGLKGMLADPSVRRLMAISSVMMTGYDLFFFYMPIYLHGIGMSASTIGIILGIFSGAGLLVRTILPWLVARFSVERVLICSFYFGAAGYFVLPLFQNVFVLCAISFFFGLVMSVAQPIIMALSFTNAADGRSGAAMGLRQVVNHSTRVAGPLVFGAIGSALGVFGVFWINALMLVGGSVLAKSGKIIAPKS